MGYLGLGEKKIFIYRAGEISGRGIYIIVLDEGTRGVRVEEEGWDAIGRESVLVMICEVLMEMH